MARETATEFGRRARVVHAIPGRVRLQWDGDGRGSGRAAQLASRIDELRQATGIREVRLNPGARSLLIRYEAGRYTHEQILALAAAAGLEVADRPAPGRSPPIPRDLDRRLLRTLAIGGVSLYAARQVGAAVGGAATLPAYLVIWFALRRLADVIAREPR
jgi:hypothetical protein